MKYLIFTVLLFVWLSFVVHYLTNKPDLNILWLIPLSVFLGIMIGILSDNNNKTKQ